MAKNSFSIPIDTTSNSSFNVEDRPQSLTCNNDSSQRNYVDVSNINPRYMETKSLPQKAWQGIKDNPWTTLKTILTIASYIILSVFSGGLSFGATAGIYAGITLFSIVWNTVVARQNGATWSKIAFQTVLRILIAAVSFGFLNGASEWLGNVLHPSIEPFLTESVNFTVQNMVVPITDIVPHAICAGELVLSALPMADRNEAKARAVQRAASHQPKNLLRDIHNFDKNTLRSLNVYFSNTNSMWESGVCPYHDFLVAGVPGSSKPVDSGKAYRLSTDIMRAPVRVTDTFIAKVSGLGTISATTISALKNLRGKNYRLVEYFLRALIKEQACITNQPSSDDHVDYLLAELSLELKDLVKINKQFNVIHGAYKASMTNSKSSERDLKLFQNGKTTNKRIPIKLSTLQEVIREQAVYDRYLNETIGVGKATKDKATIIESLDQDEINLVKNKWVGHKRFSKGLHQSNCNKAAASLAQACINKEKKLPYSHYQSVPTGTILSIGSKDRMYIHDPTR